MGLLREGKYLVFTLIALLSISCSRIIHFTEEGIDLSISHSYNNSFVYDAELSDSIKLLWTEDLNGSFATSSVAFYEKYLICGELSGRLYVLDLLTGKQKGVKKYKGEIAVSPVIVGKRIYYVVNDYKEDYFTFYIYDVLEGEEFKERRIKGSCNNELLIENNEVFVLSDQGTLIKYNIYGTKQWLYKNNSLTLGNMAVSDGIIYFGNIDGEIIAINSKDGRVVDNKKISESFESGVAVSSNHLIIGDSKGVLHCLDKSSLKEVWNFESGNKIITTPVIKENKIFIGNLEGKIYSLFLKDGSVLWKKNLGGILNITPVILKDKILVPNMNKKIDIIEIDTGKILTTLKYEKRVKMVPSFFKNILVVGTDRGELYVYENIFE